MRATLKSLSRYCADGSVPRERITQHMKTYPYRALHVHFARMLEETDGAYVAYKWPGRAANGGDVSELWTKQSADGWMRKR
jgi:hypothetical protein